MKVFYFVTTLFVVWIVCDASDEPKCKQGETYEKDCNTCHCTDAGVEVCTERACYNGPQFPDTVAEDHTEIPETNGQVCTPNETKMEDCNRCKCSANGIVWICTRRYCPTTAAPKIAVNEPGFTCVPNQVFKDDCNTCSCDESGTLARCTAMACDPSERKKRSNAPITTEVPTRKFSDCEPGTRWKNDCNWCWCTETGIAACTLKGCLGHGQKFHKFHPAPGAAVVDTNNMNKVSEPVRVTRDTTGRKSGQHGPIIEIATVSDFTPEPTQKPDPSRLSPKNQKSRNVPSESVPNSSSSRPKDYNTKEYTEAQIKDPKFSCVASEAFKVECNTCWCNSSGTGIRYCTRQACHPKVYPTLAPPQ